MSRFVKIWNNYITVFLPMTYPSFFVNDVEIYTSGIKVLNHASNDEDVVIFVANCAGIVSIRRWQS